MKRQKRAFTWIAPLLVALLGVGTAWGKGNALTRAMGPSASAADIPALESLLERAGWTPTPELSGVFKVGSIFRFDEDTHSLMVRSCFDSPVGSDTYMATELVTQLQAGVRVRAGLFGLKASVDVVKRVKFGAPVHHTIERLGMEPTAQCQEMLSSAQAGSLEKMYVVQEVLTAEIAQQTCGRVDAKGNFVGLGAAELELSRACMQEALEPVAVAYRLVPVLELPGISRSTSRVTKAQPATTAADCPWGPIKTVSSTRTSLTVNGEVMDVRGEERRAALVDTMQRCGREDAANAFRRWRAWRRTTNISGATIIGFYPFSVGIVAAVQAGWWRTYMETVLLDPGEAIRIDGRFIPSPKKRHQ